MLLSTAMERLSTGKRINSAKDDAAGLAIALDDRADPRHEPGRSATPTTASRWRRPPKARSSEVTNMLQRMRELAVQSASAPIRPTTAPTSRPRVTRSTTQITNIADQHQVQRRRRCSTAPPATAADGRQIQARSRTRPTISVDRRRSSSSDQLTVDGGSPTSTDRRHRRPTTDDDDSALSTPRSTNDHHGARRPRRGAEPAAVGGQQPDHQRHQPVRRAQPHRGRRLLGRDDHARQGADPEPGIDRDARPGEPEPAGRAEAAPVIQSVGAGTAPHRVTAPTDPLPSAEERPRWPQPPGFCCCGKSGWRTSAERQPLDPSARAKATAGSAARSARRSRRRQLGLVGRPRAGIAGRSPVHRARECMRIDRTADLTLIARRWPAAELDRAAAMPTASIAGRAVRRLASRDDRDRRAALASWTSWSSPRRRSDTGGRRRKATASMPRRHGRCSRRRSARDCRQRSR